MRIHYFAAASLLVPAASSPAMAADETANTGAEVSEAIVTATRLPAEARDEPSVRIIDSAEIDARQASFIGDLLSTVPGVSVSRNGGFGGVTSVRMRGASSDKTLVVIDGAPQNDASQPAGGFDFGTVDLSDVRRVEVLSGPQGSIWGSDAIGGVIAITTREPDGVRGGAEAGSFGVLHGYGSAGHSEDGYALGLSVSGYRADGVSRAAVGSETDGERVWTAGVNGRLSVNDKVSFDGKVRYSDSYVDIDGYDALGNFTDTPEYATSRSWTGFGRATIEGPWGFTHQLSLSAYDLKRASLGGFFPSSYVARRRVWRWTAEKGAPADRFGLIVGAEKEDIKASLSTGDKDKAGATSAFVVLRYRPIEDLVLTGSLRVDDPKDYDARGTGRIAAVWQVGGGFSLQGSLGQGFKTPTISETACDFCFPPGPSTDLRPELATGWDGGVAWRSPEGRFEGRVLGYQLRVRDQISYGVGRYVNIDRTRTNGVEADFTAELAAGWTLKGGYAWTDAIDKGTGARLLRIPENSGSLALFYDGGRWRGAFTVRGESSQADSDPSTFSPATRKGFVVADLAGGWKLSGRVELTARIENIADTRYQESLGYGEAGRGVYVGIRLRD